MNCKIIYYKYSKLICLLTSIISVVFVTYSILNWSYLRDIREFLENIFLIAVYTTVSCLIIKTLLYDKFKNVFDSDKSISNDEKIDIFDNHKKCVLIDGVWGSGKTFYYRQKLEPILKKHFLRKIIYLSCFSASKVELVNQIILANPFYRIFTLNGILAKLMESSWQSFMPKNAVVVFDDLERLNPSDNGFSDIMGILNYLKEENQCKLLLICNIAEINDQLFNQYLEKVVDHVYGIEDIDTKDRRKVVLEETKVNLSNQVLIETIKENILELCKEQKFYNLRLIRNSYVNISNSIAEMIKKNYDDSDEISPFDNEIFKAFILYSTKQINFVIKLNHLFFIDNQLYRKIQKGLPSEEYHSMLNISQVVADKLLSKHINSLQTWNDEVSKSLSRHNLTLDELKLLLIPKYNIIESGISELNFCDFAYKIYLSDYIGNELRKILIFYFKWGLLFTKEKNIRDGEINQNEIKNLLNLNVFEEGVARKLVYINHGNGSINIAKISSELSKNKLEIKNFSSIQPFTQLEVIKIKANNLIQNSILFRSHKLENLMKLAGFSNLTPIDYYALGAILVKNNISMSVSKLIEIMIKKCIPTELGNNYQLQFENYLFYFYDYDKSFVRMAEDIISCSNDFYILYLNALLNKYQNEDIDKRFVYLNGILQGVDNNIVRKFIVDNKVSQSIEEEILSGNIQNEIMINILKCYCYFCSKQNLQVNNIKLIPKIKQLLLEQPDDKSFIEWFSLQYEKYKLHNSGEA